MVRSCGTCGFRKGMSQEKLGLLTNLNKRTIQQAENGQPVAIESLAFMAEALEVAPEALRGRQLRVVHPSGPPKPTIQGEIVVVPVTRRSRLVNSLRAAFLAKFEYEAESTDEYLKPLEEVALVLNRPWADPSQPPHLSEMSDTDLLRLQATANRVIPVLADLGIRIFVGLYPSWQQRPLYMGMRDFMYIRETFTKERLFNVCVVISDEPVGYVTESRPTTRTWMDDSLLRVACNGSVARLEQAAGDDLGLDFGGALEDREDAGVAEHAADRVFEGEAVAAVDLQGVVGQAQAMRAARSLAMPASRSQRRPASFSRAAN